MILAAWWQREPCGIENNLLVDGAEPEHLFAAEHGGEILGTASLWTFAGVAGIYSVATTESARRQGLASAVIRQLMAVAAAEGYEWAVLRTFGTLPEFYGRLGFSVVGQMERFVYEP